MFVRLNSLVATQIIKHDHVSAGISPFGMYVTKKRNEGGICVPYAVRCRHCEYWTTLVGMPGASELYWQWRGRRVGRK